MTKLAVGVNALTSSALWNWKVLVGFVVVNVVWGSTYLGIRIAVHTIPPFFMAGTRFVLAGCLLVGATRLLGYRFPRGWAELKPALIMGFLLLLIGNGLVSHAEVYVPSNQAALLISTSALWMSWLGSLGVQGQPLTTRIKFGLIVGMLATVAFITPIVATLLGYVALNEAMTPLQLTGMFVIVGAIVLVTTPK